MIEPCDFCRRRQTKACFWMDVMTEIYRVETRYAQADAERQIAHGHGEVSIRHRGKICEK